MDSVELEESKEEAIRALFDESQIVLYALAYNIPPFLVRQRLLAHIAGAEQAHPPFFRPAQVQQPMPSPLSLSLPANHPSAANLLPAAALPPSSSSRRPDPYDLAMGPIYARIIPPRR